MSSIKSVKFADTIPTNNHDSRIIINVGGTRFETQRTTLKKLPATRLSKLTPQLSYYDPVLNEYFFDRHPGVFSQILNYYRTGRLHYPTNVCGPLFEDELNYWGIQREEVEPCCWMTYTKHRSTQETLQVLDSLELDTVRSTPDDIIKKFGWENDHNLISTGQLSVRKRLISIIWQLFEEPRSSLMAKIIAVISMFFIILSIALFILRTLPVFDITEYDILTDYTNDNLTEEILVHNTQRHEIISGFDTMEWICNSWFVFEIILRFLVAPSKRAFCTSILNWIDFLGTFWFFFTYIIYNIFRFDGYNAALDLLSTIRVARMFKLCNLHPRLKVIITSMSYSSSVLSLLIFFFFLAIMIAGSSMYYAERLSNSSDSQLISIAEGIWLAISTISTLGFGDIVPKSLTGMIFGAITTIVGVLIIDLPMPIIVETFANFNSHLQARQQLPKQRRRVTRAIIPRKINPLMPSNGHDHQHRF
ncbi:unnamed protein product [Rotaria sp. Silwood1]|nr:unnamed protein product [Rotaria sp. Silwood1]CAF1381244.1 unnamed protein product [Rotaria sp. Silwood1]CAF1384415.1 unnamed protein product [Rotaria sp. Silwood1]CAF3542560.1 unnamed protein product [Rotaria sp. Silwood1]CAF3583533.1 unnamed protein product [Rotaria sp. Silwood1]